MNPLLPGFVALIVLFSGCILPGTGPLELGEDHIPWTSSEAGPWLALTRGCGMCIGSGDYVEANTLVVYEDGSVLWYAFGFAENAERENKMVVAEPSLEPWAEELQRVVPMLENWHTQNRTLHVHQVAVNRIQDEAWHPLAEELTALEARLEDPGPPRYGCEDCSAPTVELLGEPRLTAKLLRTDPAHPDYGNYRDGEAWDRFLSRLIEITEWAQAWKQPE